MSSESWLFPDMPAVLYGTPGWDSIMAHRAELESTLEALIPAMIEKYEFPADDLSVVCMKRILAAESKREPGRQSKRMTLSKSRRAAIRDLYGNRCAVCRMDEPGNPNARTAMTIDHIVPLAMGGSNAAFNLQLLCFECNGDKGAMDMIDWLDSRAALHARFSQVVAA